MACATERIWGKSIFENNIVHDLGGFYEVRREFFYILRHRAF